MTVMDQRRGSELQAPAGGLQPAAQVEVAAGANPLGERPNLLECNAADQKVARGGPSPIGPDQTLGMIEEVSRASVSRGKGPLIGIAEDLAGHRAAVVGDRLGEVGVQQVWLRP